MIGARGDTPFYCESAPLKIHTPYSASKASYSLRLRSFVSQDSLDKRKFSQPVTQKNDAEARVASERIFINENLTAFCRILVKKTTDKKNEGLILGVWTIDGKVSGNTSPDGNPIRISYESDLDNL